MDFQMDSKLDEKNERWNVTLSGEIDIFNSAKLKTELSELLAKKDAELYLNCKALEYIDSTALGALVGVMKTVKSNGREMHLVSVKPNLMKLFRITNLDQVFVIEGGGEDADA
jgi:anti-sigma B factor antagonist